MITSSDPKSNAMLIAIQQQRDSALEGVALMAGNLAEAHARIAELQANLDNLLKLNPSPEIAS
jgi:hypothetical protein